MSIADYLRLYWRVYVRGGVVGLFHFMAMLRVRRRILHLEVLKERERALHQENMRILRLQHDQAVAKEQDTKVHAAKYWRAVRGELS